MGKRLTSLSDEELCCLLKAGNNDAFSEIYERYWEGLYRYAFNKVNFDGDAFDITQEIFVSLWVRRQDIVFHTSLPGYLYTALRYQIIRHIRKSKLRSDYLQDFIAFRMSLADNSIEETVHLHELENAVARGLEGLPKRCQEIFRMSRQEHKTIKEISEQLNLSHKTVENQITTALKHLRVTLDGFVVVTLLMNF